MHLGEDEGKMGEIMAWCGGKEMMDVVLAFGTMFGYMIDHLMPFILCTRENNCVTSTKPSYL